MRIAILITIILTACEAPSETTEATSSAATVSDGVQCIPYTINGQELVCDMIDGRLSCNPTSKEMATALGEATHRIGEFKKLGCAWVSETILSEAQKEFFTTVEGRDGNGNGRIVCWAARPTEYERKVSCD